MSNLELDMNQEQQELERQAQENSEQTELDEGKEAMGYSSDYYETQMANALKNGNKIAYDNARRDWAKAKARETTGG